MKIIYDFKICPGCNNEITPEVGAIFPEDLCPDCWILSRSSRFEKKISKKETGEKIVRVQFA